MIDNVKTTTETGLEQLQGTFKERLYDNMVDNSSYESEHEREFQYIRNVMRDRDKELFIHEIITLYRFNDWLESTGGGFAEIFAVYVRSKEFERLSDDRKKTFLENQYAVYDMFKEIENFSENHGVGKYR